MQIWQELPELYWYFEAPRKKPLALVLAEHPTVAGAGGKLPLIVYQFLGSGKVTFHAFDDTWRWRFRSGDKYFGRFWVQVVRFMARSRLVGQHQAEIQPTAAATSGVNPSSSGSVPERAQHRPAARDDPGRAGNQARASWR
jgi:hypothetical protein